MATDWEAGLRAYVARCIEAGLVPTPTMINANLRGVRSNVLNGRWTRVRAEMLSEAGYRRFASPLGSSRWIRPGEEPPSGWRES